MVDFHVCTQGFSYNFCYSLIGLRVFFYLVILVIHVAQATNCLTK